MNQTLHSPKAITVATVGALLTAVGVLVAIILPAEYGYDPLGTGERLGLNALSLTGTAALREQQAPWQSDSVTFELAPFEGVEYKYSLKEEDALLFSWHAGAELLFDMHAEPEGAAEGYAETFAKARAEKQSGTYFAPFTGIHGWFWQNRTQENVVLTLQTSGFYQQSIEFRDGNISHYVIADSRRTRRPQAQDD